MNRIIIITIMTLLYIPKIIFAATSFTATGEWKHSETSSRDCSHFMCTAGNLSWHPSYPAKFYDKKSGCDALLKKGITKIFFHGDSYMRQIYAGLLITLNGDYRYGSISNSSISPGCEYHKQFYEKKCGTRELNHFGVVCDGKISLDPYLAGLNSLSHCSDKNGSVILWSFGNYKLGRYGRSGVNNATLYQQFFERDICPIIKKKSTTMTTQSIKHNSCSVWWVSTHYRVRAYFPDEKPELVKAYNLGMRSYFDSGACGSVNYIDVYNMTSTIASNHPSEAEKLTYDGVHWGFELNLVKAQIILNALVSSED